MFNDKTDAIINELNQKRKIKERKERRSDIAASLESSLSNFINFLGTSLEFGVKSYDKKSDYTIKELEFPFLHSPKGADTVYFCHLLDGRRRVFDFSADGVNHYRVEITADNYEAFLYDDMGEWQRVYRDTILEQLEYFTRKLCACVNGVRFA